MFFTAQQHFDERRRIILPQDVELFGWNPQTPLSVTPLEGGIVVIRATTAFCKLCGATNTNPAETGEGYTCEICKGILLSKKKVFGSSY